MYSTWPSHVVVYLSLCRLVTDDSVVRSSVESTRSTCALQGHAVPPADNTSRAAAKSTGDDRATAAAARRRHLSTNIAHNTADTKAIYLTHFGHISHSHLSGEC